MRGKGHVLAKSPQMSTTFHTSCMHVCLFTQTQTSTAIICLPRQPRPAKSPRQRVSVRKTSRRAKLYASAVKEKKSTGPVPIGRRRQAVPAVGNRHHSSRSPPGHQAQLFALLYSTFTPGQLRHRLLTSRNNGTSAGSRMFESQKLLSGSLCTVFEHPEERTSKSTGTALVTCTQREVHPHGCWRLLACLGLWRVIKRSSHILTDTGVSYSPRKEAMEMERTNVVRVVKVSCHILIRVNCVIF